MISPAKTFTTMHRNKATNPLLERAYSLRSKQETRELYRDWAASYDQTMVQELSYIASDVLAEFVSQFLTKKEMLIADFGCGTGLTGQAMFERGYSQLIGLDFSAEMLAVAKNRSIYKSLANADLTGKLDFPTSKFDAGIANGIFTYGHLDAGCLPEIFRVIKFGGYFCCAVRIQVWEEMGFSEAFEKMIENESVELVTEKEAASYKTSYQADAKYLIFRKLPEITRT